MAPLIFSSSNRLFQGRLPPCARGNLIMKLLLFFYLKTGLEPLFCYVSRCIPNSQHPMMIIQRSISHQCDLLDEAKAFASVVMPSGNSSDIGPKPNGQIHMGLGFLEPSPLVTPAGQEWSLRQLGPEFWKLFGPRSSKKSSIRIWAAKAR